MTSKLKQVIMTLLSFIILSTMSFSQDHYVVEINETGISALVQFSAGITGLEVGDEIGVFDSAGLTNFNDCSSQIGSCWHRFCGSMFFWWNTAAGLYRR